MSAIFFLHGCCFSKKLSSFFTLMLVRAGCWVVMPEAHGYGARFDGDDTARLGRFWKILKQVIDELPAVRDHYEVQARSPMAASASAAPRWAALPCLVAWPAMAVSGRWRVA